MRLWKNLKKMQREGQLQQQQGYKLGSRKRNVAAHSNAVMGIVGTPSPDNTWHTPPDDAWHTFSSRSTSSGFSPRVHVARLSYPDPLKKRHTTLTNITSGRLPQHIRTTDIHYPDMFVRIIDWSKQVLHVITTACHGPRSATYRVKGQEWSDSKSLPTITSHNFWQSQQLPRSLSAARRVMMALPPPSVIMITQNISLPLKREAKPLILYIWTFTQRRR